MENKITEDQIKFMQLMCVPNKDDRKLSLEMTKGGLFDDEQLCEIIFIIRAARQINDATHLNWVRKTVLGVDIDTIKIGKWYNFLTYNPEEIQYKYFRNGIRFKDALVFTIENFHKIKGKSKFKLNGKNTKDLIKELGKIAKWDYEFNIYHGANR